MADIERWKKIIISLPEEVFFNIIRNYLGDVKTPFNKHSLINDLASFFKNEKNIEKIISLIDQDDATVLSALDVMGAVKLKTLYTLFEEKKSYYDFCLHLQNLEERMLVCTEETTDDYPLIIISPILEDVIREKVSSPWFLFPPAEPETTEKPDLETPLWLSDSLIFSTFSFLIRNAQTLKLNGQLRKKVIEELKESFSDILSVNPDTKVDIVRLMLYRLGLLEKGSDGYFRPVVKQWRNLAELTPFERYKIYLGAVFSRNYKHYISFIDAILKTFASSGKYFTKKTALEIMNLFFMNNSLPPPDSPDSILEKLVGLGFFTKKGELFYADTQFAEGLEAIEAIFQKKDYTAAEVPKVILQPNFDLYTSKNISFKEGLVIAFAAEIKGYGESIYFSLTKEGVFKALENGYSVKDITDIFLIADRFEIPQNVMFSLKSWEEEYKSLVFHSGVVFTVDERKSNIIDNSGSFIGSVCRKMAEGIYLVDRKNITVLFDGFKKSGIENIPSVETILSICGEIIEKKELLFDFKADTASFEAFHPLKLDYSKSISEIPESVDFDSLAIKRKIEKSGFSSGQKDVLVSRLERKLILFPEQISKGNTRYEKIEARGLDYNGKVRIAEEIAGKSGYLAEVVENSADGAFIKRLIKPEKVEKEGKNYFLKGILPQDDSEVSISISKISLIRKIRTSLFVK